jgi:hypothetical protein
MELEVELELNDKVAVVALPPRDFEPMSTLRFIIILPTFSVKV